jgi:predicted nuclease with TOPRIM domain
MQDDLQANFQHLGQKLQQWLKLQDHLVREKERLKADNQHLQEQLKEKEAVVKLLEEQVAILKSAAGPMDDPSRKDFEKKINQYIRDIDKVIAHLNT